MASESDQSDELSVLDGNDRNVSLQDIAKWVIDGDYILKKDTKGSRACMGAVSNHVLSFEVLIVQLE